jgi:hypothetical protein
VLVFDVKPALIACDDVAKMGSLHSLQHTKKLTAFCHSQLPSVIYQLVRDPMEMKTFRSQRIVQTTQDGCGRHIQGLGQ